MFSATVRRPNGPYGEFIYTPTAEDGNTKRAGGRREVGCVTWELMVNTSRWQFILAITAWDFLLIPEEIYHACGIRRGHRVNWYGVPKSPPLGLIDMKNVCSNQLRPPTLCDRPARGEDTKWISVDTWWFMLNTADYTTLWMRKLMIFTAKRGCLNLSIRKEENWKNLIMRILLPKAFLIKLYWNWIYATVVIIWIN